MSTLWSLGDPLHSGAFFFFKLRSTPESILGNPRLPASCSLFLWKPGRPWAPELERGRLLPDMFAEVLRSARQHAPVGNFLR